MFKLVFRFLLIASLFVFHTPAFSSETGGGEGGDGGNNSRGTGSNARLNNSTTNQVIRFLKDGARKCPFLQPIYRHDCYRYHFKRAADVLNNSLVYSLAHDELRNVETTLRHVVKNNSDPSVKPIRRGLRTYAPIKPAAIPQANAAAEQAMQRAETVLLRASGERQTHFARIADAVNSNKVLLRSALLPGGLFRVAWSLFQLRPT